MVRDREIRLRPQAYTLGFWALYSFLGRRQRGRRAANDSDANDVRSDHARLDGRITAIADKIIRFEDGSYRLFPQTTWSFSHWSEFRPVAFVSHGSSPISVLPRRERSDLDDITFTPIGETRPMTWAESLAANYTDGIVVLHRGRIVYEHYFGALSPERAHIALLGNEILLRHASDDADRRGQTRSQ